MAGADIADLVAPRLTDAELDALLKAHVKRECFCGCGDTGCPLCGDGWPCETVRLATEVRDQRQWREEHLRDWYCEPRGVRLQSQATKYGALASYEEGGR